MSKIFKIGPKNVGINMPIGSNITGETCVEMATQTNKQDIPSSYMTQWKNIPLQYYVVTSECVLYLLTFMDIATYCCYNLSALPPKVKKCCRVLW